MRQQVRVGELAVALQPGVNCFHGCGNLKAVSPEFVTGMGKVLAEQRQRFGR
jgi:hypothetical protein